MGSSTPIYNAGAPLGVNGQPIPYYTDTTAGGHVGNNRDDQSGEGGQSGESYSAAAAANGVSYQQQYMADAIAAGATPAQAQEGWFQQENGGANPAAFQDSGWSKLMDTIIPLGVAVGGGALLAPIIAGGVGAAGSAAATGAIQGATTSALQTGLTGQPTTLKSVGTGAATGALAASGAGKALTSTLTNAGLPSFLASGLVKGGIGAGTGALGAALNGTNVGNAALLGGVSGAVSGAIGSATGNSGIGSAAGSISKLLISPLLNSGNGNTSSGTNGGAPSPNGGAPSMSTGLTSLNPVIAGATGAGLSNIMGDFGGVQSGTAIGNNSTQGSNVGNLDTSLSGTIGSALPGIAQAATGAVGTQVASNDLVNAENNAITTQQNNLGNINNIWSTQQQLGQGADTALGSALGTNGQPANYSNFENMPGYNFAVSQGTQAIQRQAAAMGSAYTPNTAAAVGQYVTGTAAQDYNTYISQLMGAAGLGTTANQGLQTANQTTANNISQLQQNIGQAQAYGATGVANSVGGLFGTNGAGTSLLNALTGSGANNSGAVGSALGNIGGSAASGAINGSSTLTGGNSTNPTGLGGSIAQAPAGNNIQYDSNGNIIGYTPNDTISGGVNSSGVPNDLSNVYSSNYSNTVNNDGSGLFSGGDPFGGSY